MDNKTPIQAAIEKYKTEPNGMYYGTEIIEFLQSLRPAEKKIIEDTWKAGYERGIYEPLAPDGCLDVREYMNKFNYQL